MYIDNGSPESGMKLIKLLQTAANDDKSAESQFFYYLADDMQAVCNRYLKDQNDAEDAFVKGFFNFFKKIKQYKFQTDSDVRAYIYMVMRNACVDIAREKYLEVKLIPVENATEVSYSPDVYEKLDLEEIIKLINQLPVKYRTVFNMYSVDGMSHAEIAKALGISEDASATQLKRARVFLKELIIKNGLSHARDKKK